MITQLVVACALSGMLPGWPVVAIPETRAAGAVNGLEIIAAPVHDDPAWARWASDSYDDIAVGLLLAIGAGDEKDGDRFFGRALDAAAWTGIATALLKEVAQVRRPEGGNRDSWPSGHSSAAFSFATVLSEEYPRLAPVWYGWAGTVAFSRVVLNRHRLNEIVVGGLLGIICARWAMNDAPSFMKHIQRSWKWGDAQLAIGPRAHRCGVSLLRLTW